MPVKHKTLPAGTDRPGFAGVTPSLYAQEHLYSGGAHGSILTRNTLNSDGAGWVQSLAGVFISTGTDLLPAFSATLPNAVQDNITRTGTVTSGTWSGLFGAVSGANLTTLNATNISSGSLADARLSSNIPLKNASNTFSNAAPIILGASSTGTLRTDQAGFLTLQGGTSGFLWRNNANSTSVVTLTDGGLITFSQPGVHTMSASTNNTQGLAITNGSSGTGASALIQLSNNTPTIGILMQASTGYTGVTNYGNDFTALRGTGTGGVIVSSEIASGAIKFFTNTGPNLRWGINSAGDWVFGASSHIADSNGTPAITSGFGTTPAIVGTDYAFRVTFGAAPGATGVVTFGHTFSVAPVVVATYVKLTGPPVGQNVTIDAITTTTVTFRLWTESGGSGSVASGDAICVLVRGY